MDTKTVKKIADTEVAAHEKKMHKGATKFAKGGVTSANAKKFGRNLARAKNQSGG